MFFSMIRLRRDVTPKDIATLGQGDAYLLHKLVWDMFSDGPDRKRDFLYRHETINGFPTFYTVSAREPNNISGLWDVSIKTYEPKLAQGERLSFKLRANPVQLAKKERTADEVEAWRNSRQERGLKSKEPTKKRVRHDVVMDAKNRLGYKDLPHEQRPHVAVVIQEAGFAWLKACENGYGFSVNEAEVRADGYYKHGLFKRKGAKPISLSTLDFNGVLTVTEPDTFIKESLYNGIGPAKAFGCGLMLVRRV